MSQNQLITNDFIYRLKLRVTDAYVTYNTSQCNPWHNDQSVSNPEIELRWDVEAREVPDLNNETWSDLGSCMSANDNSFGSFSGTNMNFLFYDETFSGHSNENISLYVAFNQWESDGCGPSCEFNTGCQSLSCWTCPSDQCNLGTCYSGLISLPIENCNYNRQWNYLTTVICDGSTYSQGNYDDYDAYTSIRVEYYYDIMSYRGDQKSDAFGFGIIDQNGCPDVYHCFDNKNPNPLYLTPRSQQYYEFTLNHKRKLIIDCSDQSDKYNSSSDLVQYIGISDQSGYVLSPTYSNTVTAELDPGTYHLLIKNNPNNYGKYKLTIKSDDSTPYIWMGGVSNNWHEPENWSSCILPNLSTPVEVPYSLNQPNIYAGQIGECKSIKIETNNSPPAKLTIQSGALLKTNN